MSHVAGRVQVPVSVADTQHGCDWETVIPACKRGLLDDYRHTLGGLSSQGFSYQGGFVAGLHQPEKFARARRNGQALSSNGAELVSTATAQGEPSPSLPQAFSPAGHVYLEDISAAKVVKHRGQSKRHCTGASRQRAPDPGQMIWNDDINDYFLVCRCYCHGHCV